MEKRDGKKTHVYELVRRTITRCQASEQEHVRRDK